MAVNIYITNEVTGESEIYEHKGSVGKRFAVPTYKMIIESRILKND